MKEHTKIIGTACYWNIDVAGEQAELGYNLMADYFNQKLMREALLPIVAYGFEQMRLKRIDAYTHKDNVASQRLLGGLGFVRNTAFEAIYENKEELLYNTIHTLLAPGTD